MITDSLGSTCPHLTKRWTLGWELGGQVPGPQLRLTGCTVSAQKFPRARLEDLTLPGPWF